MTEEIHIHVPKGAKVIVHEDETEAEAELTLDEKIDELLRLAKEQADKPQMIQLVPMPYPVYPPPFVFPYNPPPVRYPVTWITTTTTNGTVSSGAMNNDPGACVFSLAPVN